MCPPIVVDGTKKNTLGPYVSNAVEADNVPVISVPVSHLIPKGVVLALTHFISG